MSRIAVPILWVNRCDVCRPFRCLCDSRFCVCVTNAPVFACQSFLCLCDKCSCVCASVIPVFVRQPCRSDCAGKRQSSLPHRLRGILGCLGRLLFENCAKAFCSSGEILFCGCISDEKLSRNSFFLLQNIDKCERLWNNIDRD